MKVLAVETSCDDSAAAVLDGTGNVLAERVFTQCDHSMHGGVVPEIASRLHMSVLPGLVREVLAEAGTSLSDISVFSATAGPGLTGSLLVGLSYTKSLAFALGRPFLGINHLAAHLHIHHSSPVEFPAVALLASGGHTMIFHMDSWNSCKLLGSTRDDAAGEAFDKTAWVIPGAGSSTSWQKREIQLRWTFLLPLGAERILNSASAVSKQR